MFGMRVLAVVALVGVFAGTLASADRAARTSASARHGAPSVVAEAKQARADVEQALTDEFKAVELLKTYPYQWREALRVLEPAGRAPVLAGPLHDAEVIVRKLAEVLPPGSSGLADASQALEDLSVAIVADDGAADDVDDGQGAVGDAELRDKENAIAFLDSGMARKYKASDLLAKVIASAKVSATAAISGYLDIDKTAAACGGGTANGTCYLVHLDFSRAVSAFTVTLPSGHSLGGWSCSPVSGVAGWAGASPTSNSFRCDWNTSGAPAGKALVGFQAAPDIATGGKVEVTAGACPEWCASITGSP